MLFSLALILGGMFYAYLYTFFAIFVFVFDITVESFRQYAFEVSLSITPAFAIYMYLIYLGEEK